MRWRTVWDLVKQTGIEFNQDKASRLGAALAFYTALSIAPLLLVVIGIAGVVFGEEAARGEIAHQMHDLIGNDGAAVVQTLLANRSSPRHGVIAIIIGAITAIVGATGVFAQLQDALNTIWNVQAPSNRSGILTMIRDRLLSFSMVCGMAFLLLVSLVISAIMAAMNGAVDRYLPNASVWFQPVNLFISYLLTAAMFAMIFKVLPHARPAWSDVWVGAGITAIMFAGGKYLIGLYIGTTSVGSPFGAAGSFVVLLIWIYYSTQILLFGAEFTQVYSMKYGSGKLAVRGLAKATDPPGSAVPKERHEGLAEKGTA